MCLYLYDEDSPNPMPSNCARSRSMVCLMTASLAPWRRPCRPLIPFISSICSSSESNLWRYLHNTTHRLTKQQCISMLLYMFAWTDLLLNLNWQVTKATWSLTFQWCHMHLSWCKPSSLDLTAPETIAASHLGVMRQVTWREQLWRKDLILTATRFV